MSNQPKITYRSDTTGCIYQMMQHNGTLTIQAVNHLDGTIVSESPCYAYHFSWRKTIDMFFDLVTVHINENVWKEAGRG